MKLPSLRPTVKGSLGLMVLIAVTLTGNAVENMEYQKSLYYMAFTIIFFLFYSALRFNYESWKKFVETIDTLIYTRKMRPRVDELQSAIDAITLQIDKDNGKEKI